MTQDGSTIRLSTLPNGLRIVTDTVESVESVAVMISARVGTRDEDMTHNGVAHMVEHMLFKGTARRNARRIAEEIENVGGSMNAYTGKETTGYYVHLMKEDAGLAVDILSDMYQNATLPEEEIARERDVILQEIGMYLDTPEELVFDKYYETAYPDQGLGAPTLGRVESLALINRETMNDYMARFYTPARTVVAAAGNIGHEDFVRMVESRMGALRPDPGKDRAGPNTAPAHYTGGDCRTLKDLEQAHTVLGFRGVSRLDDDYYAAQALAAVLGEGFSSRLFQEVREKRGLAYAIYAHHSAFIDDGQFEIYAGTSADGLGDLLPVLCDEVLKTAQDITEAELARTKAQMKAGLIMARESMVSRMEQQAKHIQFRNRVFDSAASVARIDALAPADLMHVAKRIFSGVPTLAALGPIGKLENYDKIRQRLAGYDSLAKSASGLGDECREFKACGQ